MGWLHKEVTEPKTELVARPERVAAFTSRNVEVKVIKSIDQYGGVTYTDGWGHGVADEFVPRLEVGREYLHETRCFSLVTGMATIYRTRSGEPVVDEWLWHKTDADLDREHAEMVARFAAERQERLERNRADWARREAALPLALRRRLERFRANGGGDFDAEGWGYELIVCELAVLYAASGQEDTEAVNEYGSKKGTSGNQHDYAKALSRHLTDDPEDEDRVANSVSALSPITGNADYSSPSIRPGGDPDA